MDNACKLPLPKAGALRTLSAIEFGQRRDAITDNENILLHLRQGLPGFSPALQKLGDFILTEPQRVLYLTLSDLAIETETSEASAITGEYLHYRLLRLGKSAQVLMLSNTLRSPMGNLADMLLVAARPEGPLNAGTLSAKVGAMLQVEVLIGELMTHDTAYTTASQQTASATLPMLI